MASIKEIAGKLNSRLDPNATDFPVVITDYLPETTTLLAWGFDSSAGVVVHENQLTPQKAVQKLTVKTKAQVYKAKDLKKKAKSFKITQAVKVTGAEGKLTYTVKMANAKSKKALKYKNGKITIKKKTVNGTYKLRVTVKAAATGKYSASKAVTKVLTVKVK